MMKTRSARLVVNTVALAWCIAVAAGASGCATQQQGLDMFWPDPPDKPRIKFVRNLQSKSDLGGPALLDTLAGGTREQALYQPMGLALSQDRQRLYVADRVWNSVFVFDFQSHAVRTIGSDERYGLTLPVGVALDGDENVYVADTGTRTVRVYDKTGKFLRAVGKDQLVRPTGVAVDASRQRLYVVDTGQNDTPAAHRVKVFDLTGTAIREIGRRGEGDGEFNFPTFASLDAQGRLYVVDSVNNRIQVFDPQGNFLFKFGRSGDHIGDFARPKGVAVDTFGNIYVVDSRWSNVQVFNQQGQLLMIFAGVGEHPGLMINPGAIVIDSQNRIYVSDTLGKRVSVYELIGTSAEDSLESRGTAPQTARGG
ncbi:MAG: SMP-30/gluconolactonase/LRE family protein [Deltaproteobacteria bacterium]|nr:SMP-30/gluconolactonase/LRE family protein [Deltaproteobacteria bacterium]